MVFPPSKPGDRYNMEVAALMKYSGLPSLGYDLKSASISMFPARISADMSLLSVKLSFDIIASTAHWEIMSECKFSESPKPIGARSYIFTQSLAECLSAEPLRKAGNKDYKFIFVSNGDTTNLVQEINELKLLEGKDLEDYLETIRSAAKRKWPGSNPRVENVTPKLLRKYLIEVRVFTIDNGTLASMRENADYVQLCKEIYFERPTFVQIEDNSVSPTAIILNYRGEDFLTAKWKGNIVHVSEEFLIWLLGCKIQSDELIKEVEFEDIPSFQDLKFRYPHDILPETADESITVCVNDELFERGSKHLALLSMSKRRLYLIDYKELSKKASELSGSDYKIKINGFREQLHLPIGGYFLKLALQEVFRAKGIILTDEYLQD